MWWNQLLCILRLLHREIQRNVIFFFSTIWKQIYRLFSIDSSPFKEFFNCESCKRRKSEVICPCLEYFLIYPILSSIFDFRTIFVFSPRRDNGDAVLDGFFTPCMPWCGRDTATHRHTVEERLKILNMQKFKKYN